MSYAKKRRQKVVWQIIAGLILLSLIVGILSYISKRPSMLVTVVAIEGAHYANQNEIKNRVEEIISGQYFWLFPKRNAFLLPRRELAKTIREQEKAIEDIDIDLAGLTGVIVQITEHVPFTHWCRTEIMNDAVVKSRECFVMTINGYIFGYEPADQPPLPFAARWYGLLETDNPRGTSFIVDPPLADWQQFVSSLSGLYLETDSITAKGNGEYEVGLVTNQKLFLNNKQTLERSLSSLRTVLNERGHSMKNASSSFEYVDLRFGSKVYVK